MPDRQVPSPSRARGSGIAVCLAGGGFPGALFEFGALAALEDGLSGWRVVDAEILVGTSCGAVVGAAMALGVTAGDVREAMESPGRHPLSLRERDFSRFPWREHLRGWGRLIAGLPRALIGAGPRSRWERVQYLARTQLPPGMFSNTGLQDLMARLGRHTRRGDGFGDLLVPLAVTATALDTGERTVFGPGGDEAIGVSLAVRASAAIPGYFSPVRVDGRDYIDGQIVDPIHLDLGAVPGARCILAVTPLSPYVRGGETGTDSRVTDLGAQGVFEQSARVSAEIKLRASRERMQRDHPDVPCFFIEPRPAEVLQLMRAGFGKRDVRRAWELGYTAATRMLTTHARDLEPLLEPACIRIRPDAASGRAR
jgi:predicted acylesterase/phospholipase RssA